MKKSGCTKILEERFLGGGKKSLGTLTLNPGHPSQGALWSLVCPTLWDVCLPTLLLSPPLLPAQLKLVAKVGNPAPLASTDKACELLK